jgi:hypothetical protein
MGLHLQQIKQELNHRYALNLSSTGPHRPRHIIRDQKTLPFGSGSVFGFKRGEFPFRNCRLGRIGMPDLDRSGSFHPLLDDEIDFTAVALIINLIMAGAQMVQDDVLRKPAGVLREAESDPVAQTGVNDVGFEPDPDALLQGGFKLRQSEEKIAFHQGGGIFQNLHFVWIMPSGSIAMISPRI